MKVLVAMSGGVDSSAAALLIKKAGYECDGVTMRLLGSPRLGCSDNGQNAEDAAIVCEKLGMRHRVVDFSSDFTERVVEPFVNVYEEGGTPNPCVECNKFIKFGKLLEFALENGYDYLATGHYARIMEKDGRHFLGEAKDRQKDQSYFLYGLVPGKLEHVLFPLGDFTKSEVRRMAEENGFASAVKKDSQDICFCPDGEYAQVIEKYTGKIYPEGDFTDVSGHVMGRHRGIINYTVGQRKGLGLALPEPAYVLRKDILQNRVVLGKNDDLFARELRAGDVYIDETEYNNLLEDGAVSVTAKTRYTHRPQPARAVLKKDGLYAVFDEPQRAITCGQSVVLYRDGIVLGGGIINGTV